MIKYSTYVNAYEGDAVTWDAISKVFIHWTWLNGAGWKAEPLEKGLISEIMHAEWELRKLNFPTYMPLSWQQTVERFYKGISEELRKRAQTMEDGLDQTLSEWRARDRAADFMRELEEA